MHEKDREIIKKLGLKFRGQKAWPMFRSYRPGFAPWFLEAGEARFLTDALNQLLDVAPRFREEASLLEPPADESYLVRVMRQEGGACVWEDRLMNVPPEPSSIPIEMDVQLLEELKRLPASKLRLEIGLFMFPSPMREKGEDRPFLPYMLLVVDAQSGLILGSEMLKPDPSLEVMWGLIPLNVAHQLARAGVVPREVVVHSELLFQLLQPLAESLRFKLQRSTVLPRLHSVKEFLFQRFV